MRQLKSSLTGLFPLYWDYYTLIYQPRKNLKATFQLSNKNTFGLFYDTCLSQTHLKVGYIRPFPLFFLFSTGLKWIVGMALTSCIGSASMRHAFFLSQPAPSKKSPRIHTPSCKRKREWLRNSAARRAIYVEKNNLGKIQKHWLHRKCFTIDCERKVENLGEKKPGRATEMTDERNKVGTSYQGIK